MNKYQVNLSRHHAGGCVDASKINGFSLQKTIDLNDENGNNRSFKDGQIFDGLSYWNKYCINSNNLDAPLDLLEESGEIEALSISPQKEPVIIYKEINPFCVGLKDNKINVARELPEWEFIQISNKDTKNVIKVKFNNSERAIQELDPKETQTFNKDEISIHALEFMNESNDVIRIQIVASINSSSL